MLNVGGPETTIDVYGFLLRLFCDREIFHLPFQKYILFVSLSLLEPLLNG